MIRICKKSLFTTLFSLFSILMSSQVTNSVLRSGDWYKFSVDTTGVFKIDRNFLQQLGISTNNINPKKIQLIIYNLYARFI